MKHYTPIEILTEMRNSALKAKEEARGENIYQDMADAFQAAIRSMEETSASAERMTSVLMDLGCLFAALELFATVCGIGCVLLGHLAAAHQMAPYAGILAILSVLSCWAVKA